MIHGPLPFGRGALGCRKNHWGLFAPSPSILPTHLPPPLGVSEAKSRRAGRPNGLTERVATFLFYIALL